MKVKTAAVQMSMSNNSQKNLNKAEKFVRQAAGDGANIILLPELFENLYFCQERNYDFYKLAETVETNPAVNRLKSVAKELNVASGSLSVYLNNLQDFQLIEFREGMYHISEPLLARWLEVEYNKRGIYPHRLI